MDELQKAAFNAGLLDLDALALLPESDASSAERIAALKAEKPVLFFNARTASPNECAAQMQRLRQHDARRASVAANSGFLSQLSAKNAAADAAEQERLARGKRANAR